MNLIRTEYTSLPLPSVTAEAEDARNELVQSALAITAITSGEQNEIARNIVVEIRNYLKSCESTRVVLTKPLLEIQRLLKALSDDHTKPLQDELKRLERLATVWLVSEEKRVAAEMAARLALAAEAKTDADFAIISNEPLPSEDRARGQTMRQELCYEITDIVALFHAKPLCVELKPRPSMIKQMCVPEMATPGIKCWWENRATFTTR